MLGRLRRGLDALTPRAGEAPRLDDPEAARRLKEGLERLLVEEPQVYRRLFLLGKTVPPPAGHRATIDGCVAAGLVRRGALGVVVPAARVFPFSYAFVATDLGSYEKEDQVFGLMLEQAYMVRRLDVRPGDDVLELCVGSGVNSLFASDRAGRVVGTDVSPRALAFAAFNVALNPAACRIELRRGSLWDAVADGETFDVVLVNPPFELVPPGMSYFLHSSGGEDGLDVVRALLPGLPARLRPGGRADFVTWSPGTGSGKDGEIVLARLLAERFPGRRIEVDVLDDRSLDYRIQRFAKKPGYAAWRERLIAAGITRVPLVWARVHPGPGGVEVRRDPPDFAAAHALALSWR